MAVIDKIPDKSAQWQYLHPPVDLASISGMMDVAMVIRSSRAMWQISAGISVVGVGTGGPAFGTGRRVLSPRSNAALFLIRFKISQT